MQATEIRNKKQNYAGKYMVIQIRNMWKRQYFCTRNLRRRSIDDQMGTVKTGESRNKTGDKNAPT